MSKVKQTLVSHDKTHGNYLDVAGFAQTLKVTMRDRGKNWYNLTPAQHESLEMIAVKISRILHGNNNEKDHWHDIAGYAMLVEELL